MGVILIGCGGINLGFSDNGVVIFDNLVGMSWVE